MMQGHRLSLLPETVTGEGRAHKQRNNAAVADVAGVSGLSACLLGALPDEARREYLQAYGHARRLALVTEQQRRRDEDRRLS